MWPSGLSSSRRSSGRIWPRASLDSSVEAKLPAQRSSKNAAAVAAGTAASCAVPAPQLHRRSSGAQLTLDLWSTGHAPPPTGQRGPWGAHPQSSKSLCLQLEGLQTLRGLLVGSRGLKGLFFCCPRDAKDEVRWREPCRCCSSRRCSGRCCSSRCCSGRCCTRRCCGTRCCSRRCCSSSCCSSKRSLSLLPLAQHGKKARLEALRKQQEAVRTKWGGQGGQIHCGKAVDCSRNSSNSSNMGRTSLAEATKQQHQQQKQQVLQQQAQLPLLPLLPLLQLRLCSAAADPRGARGYPGPRTPGAPLHGPSGGPPGGPWGA